MISVAKRIFLAGVGEHGVKQNVDFRPLRHDVPHFKKCTEGRR